jgi:endo-1,4-beta-D-glucanase Y/4-amino-4-deoxy-L-arabinose transferase-like glycosyltransferase
LTSTWEPGTSAQGQRRFWPFGESSTVAKAVRGGQWLLVRHGARIAHITTILALLVTADLFTGYNMFHYPQYELDEGTYVGSAWALIKHGKPFYYTYTYSHPPFGWLLIGVWTTIVGGFSEFGMAINNGRMLMLAVSLVSALLIYLIVRDVTGHIAAGAFASILFIVSPLGVALHRQVYLDNIGTMFLLLSILMLSRGTGRLDRIIVSAVAFGLAFWSKEIFAIFLPGMIYLAYIRSHPSNRRYSMAMWLTISLSIISLFVLVAVLKDELFPPGVLWSSSSPHVSILGTYQSQAERGGNGSLLHAHSDMRVLFHQWRVADPLLILGGIFAALIGTVTAYWNRFLFGIGILILCFVLFFGRGGIVLYYYIIPILALLAICVGVLIGSAMNLLARWTPQRWSLWAASVLVLAASVLVGQQAIAANHTNFSADRTTPQVQAAEWIVQNVPSGSTIIMDSYPWVDLREPSFTGGKTFVAHYYWPALSDPAIRDTQLHDNWHSIDYLLISPNTTADAARSSLPLLAQAIQNSDEVASFAASNWTVKIMRIRKLTRTPAADNSILQSSWQSYKASFITNGQVTDPESNGQTTSQQQADAMLRAVYANDHASFNALWGWTQAHLQRSDNGLFATRWGVPSKSSAAPAVLENNTSANADQTIAFSLILASKVWNQPDYLTTAQQLVRHIWSTETTVINGRRVMVAGNWAGGGGPNNDPATVNPSYFQPYVYRIFADVDQKHDWNNLVDSSYDVLEEIHNDKAFGGSTGLFPDWVAMNTKNGHLSTATLNTPDFKQSARDASRIALNLSIDWLWNHDDRALNTLQMDDFVTKQISSTGQALSAYNFDGTPASTQPSASTMVSAIPQILLIGQQATALKLYATNVLRGFDSSNGGNFWGADQNNIYAQTTYWYTSAVMDGSLSNLWTGQSTIDWSQAFYR